jgi:hypothetical protein
MSVSDTIIVHRMSHFNIHKEAVPEIEELYVPVLRKHYIGIEAHAVILDENEKELIHHEVIEEKDK